MITINLYDYKRIVRDVGIQKNLVGVTVGATLSVLVCMMLWIFQNMLIGMKESDLTEVKAQVATATPDYKAVQILKGKQKKFGEIVVGIDKLRSGQGQTTEFLEDVGRAIPEGVWLVSMKQMDMEGIRKKEVPFLFIDYSKKLPRPKKGEKGPVDRFIELREIGRAHV